jgi:hypothetical protein
MRPLLGRPTLLVAGCVLTLAGCGGGGNDQGSARDAAQAYIDARNHRDAVKICELYSDQLKRQLHASSCEAFVTDHSLGAQQTLGLLAVHVTGDTATAHLEISGLTYRRHLLRKLKLSVRLERQDGDWRISSLGPGGA